MRLAVDDKNDSAAKFYDRLFQLNTRKTDALPRSWRLRRYGETIEGSGSMLRKSLSGGDDLAALSIRPLSPNASRC
ncbi:MAG: hypothetical protein R3C55_12350 [Parvularculaceae bacterium]